MKNIIVGILLFSSPHALAWGKRGHVIVCETAALLVASEPNADFLKARAFDLGYYCNVPDFIWKREATYGFEKPQHFMDLEHFDAAFKKKPEVTKPFELSRLEFDKLFPEVSQDSGRAFWRTKEFYDKLVTMTTELKKLSENKDEEVDKARKQDLQGQWLVTAGIMGHYVGDMAMPLHATENHDGQLTGQKGIHWDYEDGSLDELYPNYRQEIHDVAKKRWPEFRKKNSDKSVAELMEQLARISYKDIKPMLENDNKVKRVSMLKIANSNRKMFIKNMVDGSLTLAELYRRQVGWKFYKNRNFYFFEGEPAYVMPPKADTKKG